MNRPLIWFARPTPDNKIVSTRITLGQADPEEFLQGFMSAIVFILLRDRPCLEVVLWPPSFRLVLLLKDK